MSTSSNIFEFIQELSGYAKDAETNLEKIEENLIGNKALFSLFSEQMIAIRGTAEQLELSNIARIARLGEEIAVKGENSNERRHIRKCVGSLWDTVTTVKYMLENYVDQETSDEQEILMNRLNKTLESLGGARPTLDDGEIKELLKKNAQ